MSPRGAPLEDGKFENLWKVQRPGLAMSFFRCFRCLAALLPLVLLLLVPVLVPQKGQTEPLLDDHKDSATHNSPFERWQRR